MLKSDTKIKIQNRSGGTLGYNVPDLNIRRDFSIGEVKEVTFEEIEKISYTKGGMYLLKHSLVMNNPEAVEAILGEVEPEYYYSENEIKRLLTSGTVDELLDCLDFAPHGVIERLEQLAIQLEIPDMNKRKAIQDKTGINISSAIEFKEEEPDEEEKPTKRRVAAKTTSSTSRKRKTKTPSKEELMEQVSETIAATQIVEE